MCFTALLILLLAESPNSNHLNVNEILFTVKVKYVIAENLCMLHISLNLGDDIVHYVQLACVRIRSQPCSRIINQDDVREDASKVRGVKAGHQQVCHHHHLASWPSSAE